MSFAYKKIPLILLAGLLTACSGSFDELLFSLTPHPQEPKERPYITKPVEFTNPRDGTQLSGELTYPRSGSHFPAFVLISGHEDGAPPADKNYHITGHKYFLVISDLLTKHGYAVLRYDNRGVGESSGDYTTASDRDFASDAAAALQWLRKDSGIKLSSSGFLGHSQGGVKALMAEAHERPDYIVSLAGLDVETSKEFLVRQNQKILSAQSVDPSTIERITQELAATMDILKAAENINDAKLRLREYAVNSGVTEDDKIQKFIDHFATNWWFEEVRLDDTVLLKSYNGPVLSLYGSKDLLVSASINEEPVRKLLTHQDSEVHTMHGLNHLFQTADKGGPNEYWEIETTIEEKAIEKIDLWTRRINQRNVKKDRENSELEQKWIHTSKNSGNSELITSIN
ncbi:hypothetical protein DI392_04045 [Vibrio albus]|uniref:Xaa-Pro dipeptidyl-peptidase-like domain-containing protein n=1 Tax=Vibrio albus TaxID=2200953 RepID=A0A2U3BBX4_9VIBR|nr:alpha/beta fold hydrolase [Vibrio albus]PWI34292.1 hypothetical protein DI392_04045 [Vibrio albus]